MTELTITGCMIDSVIMDLPIPDPLWDWSNGVSSFYWANSPNRKIEEKEDKFIVSILAAGFKKDDIKASIEDEVLTVTTSKPGWNGVLMENIPLSTYNLDMEKVEVTLIDGILVIVFEKQEKFKKKSLKIE